ELLSTPGNLRIFYAIPSPIREMETDDSRTNRKTGAAPRAGKRRKDSRAHHEERVGWRRYAGGCADGGTKNFRFQISDFRLKNLAACGRFGNLDNRFLQFEI